MTITECRDRLLDLRARLRRARFDGDQDAIDRICKQLDEALDEYNAGRTACSD